MGKVTKALLLVRVEVVCTPKLVPGGGSFKNVREQVQAAVQEALEALPFTGKTQNYFSTSLTMWDEEEVECSGVDCPVCEAFPAAAPPSRHAREQQMRKQLVKDRITELLAEEKRAVGKAGRWPLLKRLLMCFPHGWVGVAAEEYDVAHAILVEEGEV